MFSSSGKIPQCNQQPTRIATTGITPTVGGGCYWCWRQWCIRHLGTYTLKILEQSVGIQPTSSHQCSLESQYNSATAFLQWKLQKSRSVLNWIADGYSLLLWYSQKTCPTQKLFKKDNSGRNPFQGFRQPRFSSATETQMHQHVIRGSSRF